MSSITILPLVTGVIFLVMGLVLLRYYPKKINPLFGYRTRRSMRDQASWDLAQQYSSREMIRAGVGLCLLSLLGYLVRPAEAAGFLIGLGIVILATVVMILRVEWKLKAFHLDQRT